MRLFRKFTQSTNESVMDSLYPWLFGQISINGITLDLDSTVMTRYGAQEGAVHGYNPAKRGRASHPSLDGLCTPSVGFALADTRMIAHCWLRPGNTRSANNVQAFLANTLHRLGEREAYPWGINGSACCVSIVVSPTLLSWIILTHSNCITSSPCVRISPCNARW